LESLSLAHAKFTDAGAPHLAKLTRLKNLEVGTRNASPKCLEHLAKLPLESLQLGDGLDAPEGIALVKAIPTLRRLVAAGTQLRPFPRPVMEACYRAAFELYDETAARNANFKKVYEHFKTYRDSQLQWFRVAESTYDNFVYGMQAAETAPARPR
jgi:hypothetical protein